MTMTGSLAHPSGTRLLRLVPSLVALVILMQVLDGTIITTSLAAMATDFGVDPVTMSVGRTTYLMRPSPN